MRPQGRGIRPANGLSEQPAMIVTCPGLKCGLRRRTPKEVDQGADAKPRRAFRGEWPSVVFEVHTGDVQVNPRSILCEFLQELSCCNSAAPAVSDILDVRDL